MFCDRVIKKGIQLSNRNLVNTILYADDQILMATSEDDYTNNGVPPESYSKKIQKDHIQHKNKSNGNVGEPHTEGKNCDKRKNY